MLVVVRDRKSTRGLCSITLGRLANCAQLVELAIGFSGTDTCLQHRTGWSTTTCEEVQIFRIQQPGDMPAWNTIYNIISRAGHILQLTYQGDHTGIRVCKRPHIERTLEDTPLAGNMIGDILDFTDRNELNNNQLCAEKLTY